MQDVRTALQESKVKKDRAGNRKQGTGTGNRNWEQELGTVTGTGEQEQ